VYFIATQVCSVNNGGCTQKCIDDEDGGAKCVCDKGYGLAEDERTCIGMFYSTINIIGSGICSLVFYFLYWCVTVLTVRIALSLHNGGMKTF